MPLLLVPTAAVPVVPVTGSIVHTIVAPTGGVGDRAKVHSFCDEPDDPVQAVVTATE